MKCTFCGYDFDISCAPVKCAGCLIKKGCDLIQCPNCRFELVAEPKKAATDKPVAGNEETLSQEITITELELNREAVVTRLNTDDRTAMRKLIAMGVLPDTEIRLIQKFPSYVFQSQFDRFTLDRELASYIFVRLA